MPEAPLPTDPTPSLNEDTSKTTALDDAIQAEVAKLESPAESQPEDDKSAETAKPDDARLVQLAKQRRALDREKARLAKEQRDLQAKAEAAEKQAAEKTKQAEELEALLKGLSTPEGLQAVLQKAGIDFNALARAGIGLKPTQQDPGEKAIQELEALKRELAEERAARAEAQKRADETAQKQRQQAVQQQAAAAVSNHIRSKAAEYKHLASDGQKAVDVVLQRSWKWLQENQEALGRQITDSEEIELVDFFCKEVEAEYQASALAVAQKLAKLGIIPAAGLGINPNTNNANSGNGLANNDSVSAPNADLDPESQAIVSQYKANPGGNKPQKFITNDSTLSIKPGNPENASNSARLTSDERLEKLIEQFR
jgi:hypothetical protein